MRRRSLVLGVSSALVHGTTYILYNLQVSDGDSTPNAVSWGIWAVLASLNALSFGKMTGWVKTLQFIVGSLGAIGTFLFALWAGAAQWPLWWEWFIAMLGGASAIALFRYRHAAVANLLALIGALIGAIPTLIGVWTNPDNESPLAWILWTFAFILTFINVRTMSEREREAQREKLGRFTWVPSLTAGSMIVLHILIAILCLR